VRRKGDDNTSAIEKKQFPRSQQASERLGTYARARKQNTHNNCNDNNPKAKLGFTSQKLPTHYKSILG
jgi:hypothetical protein